LNPELTFELLVVADGFVPTYTRKRVDPHSGVVAIVLRPHDLDQRVPALIVRGRVQDEAGQPVERAIVELYGFQKGNTGMYGRLEGIDPLAVTNSEGEFRIGVSEKGVALHVKVSARYFAPKIFSGLLSGRKTHELKLQPGVTITGTVTKDSQPLPGVAVGLVQQNRNTTSFVGDFKIAANERGEFAFLNVPSRESYFVYGLMESLHEQGGISAVPLRVEADGKTIDVGTLTVQPACRLSGQVLLSDGTAVPPGTRVLISREQAWDSQVAVVAEDGGFAFRGLPKEHYTLAVNVRGYHVSPKNESADLVNGLGLVGAVTGDIEGFRLLLEPGPRQAPDLRRIDFKEYQRRKDNPLRGAPQPGDGK